jgi:hypothetical protein
VGAAVGTRVGSGVGEGLGKEESVSVGVIVGRTVGADVGRVELLRTARALGVGTGVGIGEGEAVDGIAVVGLRVGAGEVNAVGTAEGAAVTASVPNALTSESINRRELPGRTMRTNRPIALQGSSKGP